MQAQYSHSSNEPIEFITLFHRAKRIARIIEHPITARRQERQIVPEHSQQRIIPRDADFMEDVSVSL